VSRRAPEFDELQEHFVVGRIASSVLLFLDSRAPEFFAEERAMFIDGLHRVIQKALRGDGYGDKSS